MDRLYAVRSSMLVRTTGGGKRCEPAKYDGNGEEKYRKPACTLSETDDGRRCRGRRQGELARRRAYGHYRPRPDTREHEQKPLYQSRDKKVQETINQPREPGDAAESRLRGQRERRIG